MAEEPITEVTVRWSLAKERGVIPAPQRARILKALKERDIRAMDLVKDAINELTDLYEDGGFQMEQRYD